MKTAEEILEMTRKESKLAKACDEFIKKHMPLIEAVALEGHRTARAHLSELSLETRCSFTYDEMVDMLSYKLEELGYMVAYNEYNRTIDICW